MTQDTASQPVALKPTSIHWGRLVVWIVVGLILVGLALALINTFTAQPQSGLAPDFTLNTYTGQTITLSKLQGQVVVINFWASWCGPCAEEAPNLQAAWEAYRDRGVMFIGVDWVDSDEKGREFIERFGITYPNGPDLGTRIADAYHIRGVPETFIVNAKGEITFFAMEPLTYERLSAAIEKALSD